WGHATLVGASLSLSGAYLASLGNIQSQRAQARRLPVTASNAWGMFYGALGMGVIALLRDRPFLFEPTIGYVGSLIFLAVFASVVAFGCYLTLLGRIGAHRAGYAVVMFPVVAVAISLIFEGLVMDGYLAVGMTLVVIGNACVMGRRATVPKVGEPMAQAVPARSPYPVSEYSNRCLADETTRKQ
ncbi:MAG: DMT family transporter, partial [Xanthomonadales bacterium]|nr:DMT family transporter [Xanthomonadales bacterium]